ncbi:saccharopine dehydrogenase NADP-binding domain-containing protein [Pseudomonas fluorescens]|uniref:Saccharopine dehydrogenase NADP-binding domain-containing protein n=1 Tax=Pseudomonas fluorescens TaxID=294 RepID=A0A944DHE4_PSEFL|nr:saccharopine dehydrogenase NADP-binding domain-containing protein [Pseudomonas fluorescens]MBT2297499.1 saccharopine dehydrogenase NADP-binding domain-containing protein [Pseudomonas fluorescens]MBT2305697.1 saccharopine dehydrogenase NADP-binding domain-containing protein [Pseudomonas fluorescens]MBT2314280.1 saccharopine dehydrogenase NADP-binding domain-containing protein [Pseudomonas fluorescens]MBT2319228.1 saccharopine dehydrogenase NADP-binding domain-containing protein [Pseudomonas f
MLISVLGASGDVGLASVRALLSLGLDELRLGGRDAGKGARCLATLQQQWPTARLHWVTVDFNDAPAMAAFADGCDVLLNCAGPSWRMGDRCAQAALQARAHYVDAAGDVTLDPKLWLDRCAVLGAGLQPGLTGLLPRWLAQRDFTQVHRLHSYFGLRDQFTLVAADDFLQGATDGSSEPLAAWHNGRRSRALTRRRDVALPCFPGQVQVLPYLNHEGERLAMDLRLEVGQWFNVIIDGYVLKALDLAHSLPRAEATQRLRQASLLDLSAQAPFVTLLLQLDGQFDGQPITRSVVLGGSGNAALTGAMAAVTVTGVAQDEIPAGCHHAAQVLRPAISFERLQRTSAISALRVMDTPIERLLCAEEGSL